MDTLGIIKPAIALPSTGQSAPVLPKASAPSLPAPVPQPSVDQQVQTAEARRFAAVKAAAGDIANSFVVSDKTFSIFKDATGQYITRFTSLRDGSVKYIPEPQLFKQGGSTSPALLTIKA